jgi:hypothetical protein
MLSSRLKGAKGKQWPPIAGLKTKENAGRK